MLLLLLTQATGASAATTETFRDEFNAISYWGDDGTVSWSGAWVELGESDGPSSGRVTVRSDSRCASGNCLRIGADEESINGRGVRREADLGGATSVTLTFSYRRRLLEDPAGSVTLAISSNGGSSWTDLQTYNLNGSDSSQIPQSFSITTYTSANTQIRFLGSGNDVEGYIYIDDIEIAGQYNSPPTFDQDLSDRSDPEGASISIDAGATDPESDPLTYSASGLPPGLSINTSTGHISGVISFTAAAGSPYTVTVTVDDGNGGTDIDTLTWTITDTNRAPVMNSLGPRTVDEQTLLSFTATASDPDVPADTLSFSLVGAPTGASINAATGAFTWTPTEAQGPGGYTFDVKVTDDGAPALSDTETVTITVNEINRAPAVISPDNQTNGKGDSVSMTVSASDPDLPSNTLAFTALGLPPGLSINSATGTVSGTISGSEGSPYTVTITSTDSGSPSLADSSTFIWTVVQTNQAPKLNPVGGHIIDEGSTLTFTATASDPDGDQFSFSLVTGDDPVPVGAAINSTGVFTWTPTESQGPGTYRFRVKVADDGSPSLYDLEDVTITVIEVNLAPSLIHPGDQYTVEGSVVTVPITATDPDLPSNLLSFSATGLPPGLDIDPDSGVISGMIDGSAVAADPYTIILTVSDDRTPPLVDSATFTWTVTSLNQPIAHSATFETEPGVPVAITLTGSDPNRDPITFTVTSTPAAGTLSGTGPDLTYTPDSDRIGTDSFTFIVSDGTQDSPPGTITIHIKANQPPVANPDHVSIGGTPDGSGKPNVVQEITGLDRPAATDLQGPTIDRTLVLMARATYESVGTMGIPLVLLGLLGLVVVPLGRISLLPMFRRGRPTTGTVHLYDPLAGYGLITPDRDETDVFFHPTAIRPKRRPSLDVGDRVGYRVISRKHRDVAKTVRRLKHPADPSLPPLPGPDSARA